MTEQVYSLSISARATLDMHSLNNEGGEGNQITTRMVNIVGEDGKLHNVNAISGDMLKHIQAEHLFHLLAHREDVPLCAACAQLDANRIGADPAYLEAITGKSDAEAVSMMIERCAIDDAGGNLITRDRAGRRSIPRKSVAEYAWAVGLPELTTTDSYFHVKYANERSGDAGNGEGEREANLQQAIFHRPASSGVYAIVANLEAARIGFNDITQEYAIDQEQRELRYRALLESVLYTFIQPSGAMRATQNPHIVNLSGTIAVSHEPIPAPTMSALNSGYQDQLRGVSKALNAVRPEAIRLLEFASLAEFSDQMALLAVTMAPYGLAYEEA